jgi:hypothetical protein
LIVLILFTIHIYPLLGSGPEWNSTVNSQAQNCEKYWWTNLLFIQNFFEHHDVCLSNTHYITTDFYMYLMALCIVYYLWRSPKKTIVGLLVLALISNAARFYLTVKYGLADYTFPGMK